MSTGPRGRGPRGSAHAHPPNRSGRGVGHSRPAVELGSSGVQQASQQVSRSAASGDAAEATLSGPSNSSTSALSGTTQNPKHNGPINSGVIGVTDKSGRISLLTTPSDRCPNCKTDRYLNPRLKLLVSPCYHKLCTSCIDRIWSLGPAPCPECGHVCRKSQFGSQTFADLAVEREVDLRKRVGRLFHDRGQETFESLREYNDWLEEAEYLMYNLANGINLDESKAKLAQYEADAAGARGAHAKREDKASSSSEALASNDARLSSFRQERIARRKGEELEDVRLRQQEEDEMVNALESGLSESSLIGIQDRWKARRAALNREREVQEAEDVAHETSLRKHMEDAHSLVSSRPGAVTGSSMRAAIEWQDLSWPLLGTSTSKYSSGLGIASGLSATAFPQSLLHDPWLEPWAVRTSNSAQERKQLRAGGCDLEDFVAHQRNVGVSGFSFC